MANKEKKTLPSSVPSVPIGPPRITTLADLDRLCGDLIPVSIPIGPKRVIVEMRLLKPVETERLEVILAEASPRLVQDAEGKAQFDRSDPEYLKKLGRAQKMARALAVFWCCPLLAEGFGGTGESDVSARRRQALPGETRALPREEIFNFVQERFTDHALDILYAVARSEESAFETLVNF